MRHGLDTTVVIRLLVGEPAMQAEAAVRRLREAHEAGDEVVVSDLVVVETYIALQHHYGIAKTEVRRQLLAMLSSGVVRPEPGGVAPEVLRDLVPRKAGLVDRMILARYRAIGAFVLTFDRALGVLPGASLLDESSSRSRRHGY